MFISTFDKDLVQIITVTMQMYSNNWRYMKWLISANHVQSQIYELSEHVDRTVDFVLT
jgi:hypothetical protein